MKLGKFKMFLVLLFAVLMALSIVACDKPDKDTPSAATCDCCGETCTDCICEADKDCDPDCDCGSENCNPAPAPSCDCCGETCADCICVAGEDCDPDCDCGSENCNPVVEDTTAPVITFAQGKQDTYTAQAGHVVTLPLATANDETDGELDIDVSITTKGATLAQDGSGYSFTSNTAGEYLVSYYAIDAAENEAEEFITVIITPVVDESTLPAGATNDIRVLENGGTYVENFEKGYNGALAKGLTYSTSTGEPNASVKSTSDSIAGNSLFIDYTTCAWNTNTQFWFGSLDNYIKSGKWTVSMDVKVLGGTAPSGLYMSFVADGSVSGTDQACTLDAVDVTKTISTSGIYSFDSSKTWHFRLFFNTSNSAYSYENFVIVIDNITITYVYAEDDTVERTGTPKTVSLVEAKASGGYTITGANDNFTAVSGSGAPKYLDKSKVALSTRLTETQAANLTAANGFNSDYVILANAQLNWFDALKNLCTDAGYIYTLTLKVYAPSSAGWHFFYADGAGNSASSIKGITISAGVSTISCEFAGAASMVQIGLYLDGVSDLYIGDITISAVEKPADKSPNGYEIGKKWTKTANELNLGNKGTLVTCSDVMVDGVALSTYSGFNDKAVYFNTNSANFTCEMFNGGGTIENGCKYKITLNVYVVECTGRLMLNFDNSKFLDLGNTTGYRSIEIEWTADLNVNYFCFYFPESTAQVYISGLTYELIAL